MPLTIHGLNAGVIRHDNDFVALALKINHAPDNDILLFFPLLPLKDLLICLEYHLPVNNVADDVAGMLHSNAPVLVEEELKNADVQQRVEHVTLLDDAENSLTIAFTRNNGETLNLTIVDTHIPALVSLIIRAMNNAGLRAVVESVSSMVDFLPLYDVDCQDDAQLEYDTYQHPEWKHRLFSHYLVVIYQYINDQGEARTSGSVIKTRAPSASKDTQGIVKRLLRFSHRLRKLDNTPCKVFVRTLAAGNKVTLTQAQCLHAVHNLRLHAEQSAA